MRSRVLILLASAAIAACSSGLKADAPYSPGPPPPQGCQVTGCGAGTYCDTATHLCKTGCVTSAECSVTDTNDRPHLSWSQYQFSKHAIWYAR